MLQDSFLDYKLKTCYSITNAVQVHVLVSHSTYQNNSIKKTTFTLLKSKSYLLWNSKLAAYLKIKSFHRFIWYQRHFKNKHWHSIDMSLHGHIKRKKQLFNLMLLHRAIIVINNKFYYMID